MTGMEIVLLIVGIIVFVVSFFLPAGKKNSVSSDQKKIVEEEVKQQVSAQMESAYAQLNDTVDETVKYAMEKTERSMDKLTNEKIMAVNEYADTVLTDIHKNHEEVVFLYDMLNDKQTNIRNTVSEAEQTAKDVTQKVETARIVADEVEKVTKETREEVFQPFVIERVSREEITEEPKEKKTRQVASKNASKGTSKAATRKKKEEPKEEPKVVEKSDAVEKTDGENSNDEILRLHAEGKSNVAIAKELGLGVGEVKLVIDLFKGM